MTREILEETLKSVERIQFFEASSLSRREEFGSAMSFEDAIPPARRLIALFQQISTDFLSELTDQHLTTLRDNANNIFSIFDAILKFSAASDAVVSSRQAYIQQLTATYDSAFNAIHPLVAYLASRQRDFAALERQARASVQSATDQADELKQKLEESQKDAQRILEEVRQVATEQGVSQQATYFKNEAEDHEKESLTWRRYTIRTSIGLGLFATFSFFIHKIPFFKPETTYETIQLAISKGLVFAVIAFMLILCSRNFLSHKHNAIVNRHRQNALLTFNALVAAAKDEDKKDIVLTHAAACIFSPQETGYAKSSGGEGGQIKLIEFAPKMSSSTPTT